MAYIPPEHYIPVGCLLVQRANTGIPIGLWPLSDITQWHQVIPVSDAPSPQVGPVLPPETRIPLLSCGALSPYAELLSKQWARFSFGVSIGDAEQGIIRVNLLPDDVGRGTVSRADFGLQKVRRQLLSQLDFSSSTWNGAVGKSRLPNPQPFHGVVTDEDDQSLLQMFNNISSPDPRPELIRDQDARYFAYGLMDSDISGLKTTLYPYQRRSAALMLQRETQTERVLDPRLVEVVDQSGSPWYYDAVTGVALREPRYYDGPCGGILAEEMGSGKTLICLALILATRHQSSKIPDTSRGSRPANRSRIRSLADMVATCITMNAVPWKLYLAPGSDGKDGVEYTECIKAIRRNPGHYFLAQPWQEKKTRQPLVQPPPVKIYLSSCSLVIVPPNLVQQWRQEISKHTTGLKVLVCVAKKELPSVEELLEYDIILFSSTRFERLRIDATMERNDAFEFDSPLTRIHFKRCIVDEGHKLGNSTVTSRSNLHLMLDSLQISARWIVTGTPSKGLFGVDQSPMNSAPGTPDGTGRSQTLSESSSEQEKDDLRRIGSIAALYLKARPWANTLAEPGDTPADWSVYVMQPKHSRRSSGRKDCLRATLESLIIRHPITEVAQFLPVVKEEIIYLDGSYQDKLSLNLFSMIVIFNAVQSQRTDRDYLFHGRQRASLMRLVSNLRQASFFGGSFFSSGDIDVAVETAEKFLVEGKVPISAEDEAMLREAIAFGHLAKENALRLHAQKFNEVPIYVKNFPGGLGREWSLDQKDGDPVCMDFRLVVALQKLLQPLEDAPNSLQLLFTDSRFVREGISARSEIEDEVRSQVQTAQGNGSSQNSTLAGNTQLGRDSNNSGKRRQASLNVLDGADQMLPTREPSDVEIAAPLAETQIISTVSAKLSYLIDQVVKYQASEQIIIFYENENVAFSLAGMLEVLQIQHLIYAKSLKAERRAQYVVTFNQSPKFRVLLMDISQAAFGLDMRSASRIYFINPVLDPQVEAQAIARSRRLDQEKPVTVETLVLRESIEELIVKRRREMTQAEQRRCKTILDDRPIYDWILNAKIIPLPEGEIDGLEQTAMLKTPQFVFGRGFGRGYSHPDEDLVALPESPNGISRRTAPAPVPGIAAMETDGPPDESGTLDTIAPKGKGAVVFIKPVRKRPLAPESGPSSSDEVSTSQGSTPDSGLLPTRPARRVRFAADDDD